MARILVHALAATAGGGVTYLRNSLERFAGLGGHHEWLVLVPEDHEAATPPAPNVRLIHGSARPRAFARIFYDQVQLRSLIRHEEIDLILATGNFGMLRPPVPQVLLNRNALYFSRDHLRQLKRRGEYREALNIVLRSHMALASIRNSAVNVVPTAAFAEEIRRWAPAVPEDRFRVIPHGFDHDNFVRPDAPLDEGLRARLDRRDGVRRILMVSHYNYFRNFETLLRALAILHRSSPEPLELILTTRLGRGVKDHRYDTTHAACLTEALGIGEMVTMLGTVPHEQLYPLYRQADVVVCPSYAESFGHPMVEAMSSSRPVVASDRPEHREVCRDAARYFSVFDPSELAARLQEILQSADLARRLGAAGLERAREFCWKKHFHALLSTIEETLALKEQTWSPIKMSA